MGRNRHARLAFSVLACLSLTVAGPASAGPLDGKRYLIQMSSSQSASGLMRYLVPPMAAALAKAGLVAAKGPDADIVVNLQVGSDVGRWVDDPAGRQWLYTMTVVAGISAPDYEIPYEGTPQFGATLTLLTPNADREDELDCMIRLAVRTALVRYRPQGSYTASGQQCLRKP